MTEAAPVLSAHRLDEPALWRYLERHLEGFAGPARLEQFRGGQSNPTYLITTPDRRFVLRKKPPGRLLATAHKVEREYRVQLALAGSAVPVVPMRLLCEDPAVIGTAFYVMDFLEGRIETDPALEGRTPAERRAHYDALIAALAALHTVDYVERGLSEFGRPEGYLARQLDRWTKQYDASRTEEIASMGRLRSWLEEHLPQEDEAAIVHGDFRLGNVMFAPDGPRILAVLDWELSTIGHPLTDVAFFCLSHYLPPGMPHFGGLDGLDLGALGIPTVEELLAAYGKLTHRPRIDHWTFHLALAFYRLAAICQGIHARALQGNAADPRGLQFGAIARQLADIGWQRVQSAAQGSSVGVIR